MGQIGTNRRKKLLSPHCFGKSSVLSVLFALLSLTLNYVNEQHR